LAQALIETDPRIAARIDTLGFPNRSAATPVMKTKKSGLIAIG